MTIASGSASSDPPRALAVVVMRVVGAGKTTVGLRLAETLVDNQFATLEPPDGKPDVIVIAADADLDEARPKLVAELKGRRGLGRPSSVALAVRARRRQP